MVKGRIRYQTAILIFCNAAIIILSVCSIYSSYTWRQEFFIEENSDVKRNEYDCNQEKYLLYIGLNDKDTYQQSISNEEAAARINAICEKYVDGYSYAEMHGGWLDQMKVFTEENTLVYQFMDIGEEKIEKIMDEVLEELNQSSIMVEKEEVDYYYV